MIVTAENYTKFCVGAKAERLFQMKQHGMNVPELFCITDETQQEEVLGYVRRTFPEGTLFSVRSSASAEDSRSFSFAGQLDTFLFVPADELPEKIGLCRASADSESIADFLSLIAAARAALEMTNVKIVKGMRNDVNRKVNCDVANLQKSARAAGDQISAIRKIEEKAGLGVLPKELREVAELRLEHPDASVQELGALMAPPLQKSTMYYRIRKIKKIAETL